MNIFLNGEQKSTAATNLEALLVEIELHEAVVATALNGEFVAAEYRAGTAISEGDRIEILAPMQGG